MADEIRNFIRMKDGRAAEEVVRESAHSCEDQEEGVKVTEVWAEPKVEKRLVNRVVEKCKPMVVEKEIEVYDEETGEVIERKVESVNDVKLKLVDHVAKASSVTAQSTHDEYDCAVTREEFQRGLEMAVKAAVGNREESVVHHHHEEHAEPVSMQSFVGEKVEQSDQNQSLTNLVLLGIVAAQVAGLVYIMFWM